MCLDIHRMNLEQDAIAGFERDIRISCTDCHIEQVSRISEES
jgi:hypothetical protein